MTGLCAHSVTSSVAPRCSALAIVRAGAGFEMESVDRDLI